MDAIHPIISTLVISIIFAFAFGFIASYAKLPAIVGYIFAGIFLSPNTPGLIADVEITKQLAEIGIILLLFDVGLHLTIDDLLRVKKIAIIGALTQMGITAILSLWLIHFLGFELIEAIIFGLSIAVASTIFLIKQFDQYHLKSSETAKIAFGWLVFEDIVMIFILVLLPVLVEINQKNLSIDLKEILQILFEVMLKIVLFIIAMITIAKKILPIFMMEIYKQRSMELISLAVLAVATGFAFIAHIFFNASFALGAFLAGFVLNKSLIGRKIVKKTIPLRDIFSVLFFISVGLLFDPKIIFNQPLLILIALFLIVVVKFLISFAIMRFFNKNIQESILLSVGLAQIGEFSFVLIALGNKMNVLSQDLYDVIICSAIICIIINTFLFRIIKK